MLFIYNFLNSFIAFVIILSIVVFVHEFGHYIIAVLNGVKVDEFSIGYGKELFCKVDKRGTKWKICLLPFGGFVKFFGDEEASSSIINKDKFNAMSDEEKKTCIYFKNVYQRISIVAAGPIFNYLLAIILFTMFFYVKGVNEFSNKITFIAKDSPAERVGIMAGDKIVEINGDKINSFDEIQLKVSLTIDKNMDVVLERDNKIINVIVIPEIKEKKDIFGNKIKIPVIGVSCSDYNFKKVNFLQSFNEGIKQVYTISSGTIKVIGQMLVGKRNLDGMSGPVKIAKYSGEAMKNGFFSMLFFMALISTSLGLMNLLPIPVLDGGHLVFYIFEAIRRKPMNEKVENTLSKIGFSLLISLMIYVTIKDIFGIF